jgi:arylformamidase
MRYKGRMGDIIDISVALRPGMVTYPGDPTVTFELVSSLANGDIVNLTRVDLGAHTGTHVDAPVHFIEGAAATETLPLDVLVGPARVVDLTAAERLDSAAFDGVELAERILLKTRNSELWARGTFAEDALQLGGGAARVLVEAGVRLAGIDYLSIGDPEAHRVLLGAGVVPVEGLDLSGVEPGEYELICAPLKLVGSDGAPARVLLRRGL